MDPDHPEEVVHEEHTVPLISLLSFQFMDGVVFSTWFKKERQVKLEELPPLCDYDRADYLARQL